MPTKDTVIIGARVPTWLQKKLDQWAGHHKLSRSEALTRIVKRYFGYK